jgi:hypothetical protein
MPEISRFFGIVIKMIGTGYQPIVSAYKPRKIYPCHFPDKKP